MSQGSHEREEIRNHLLPYFEQLVDEVYQARQQTDEPMETEEAIARCGDELSAEAIGRWLADCDLEASHIEVGGDVYYRLGQSAEKTYKTVRGDVRISRHRYRKQGEHNGPTVCPLELRCGMVESTFTPRAGEAMAYAAAEMPERNAADMAAKLGAMTYSPSSFKRVARSVATRWERDRERFEDRTIQRVEIPDDTRRLAVSIDRVSLLMVEEDGLNWRMAWCGTVTMVDEDGTALKTLRFGRMPTESSHVVREQMLWDVKALVGRGEDLEVVCVSDGSRQLCEILDEDYPGAVRYIDFYHLIEKLAAAVRAYANHRPLRRSPDEIVDDWRMRLLNNDGAIDEIYEIIDGWNVRDLQVGDNRPVHAALTYIENHRGQMNYAAARRRGHPIGSGHVEACCKQLVDNRMKRNGQRWKPQGGQAILTLRSLATDARWDAAMEVMMPTFRQHVEPVSQAA